MHLMCIVYWMLYFTFIIKSSQACFIVILVRDWTNIVKDFQIFSKQSMQINSLHGLSSRITNCCFDSSRPSLRMREQDFRRLYYQNCTNSGLVCIQPKFYYAWCFAQAVFFIMLNKFNKFPKFGQIHTSLISLPLFHTKICFP